MGTHFKLSSIKIELAFIISVLLAFTGCVTDSYQVKSEEQSAVEQTPAESPSPDPQSTEVSKEAYESSPIKEEKGSIAHVTPEKQISRSTTPVIKEPASRPLKKKASSSIPNYKKTDKSAQDLLDSALAFCNASNDFWERGDLDNAVDALDEAYSLILQINPDEPPEILQQRDDLRITISKRIMQVYSSRYTVVNGYHKAIPLDMNRHVKKALNLLKGKHRKFFLSAYRRSGKYRPAIVKALKEAGLPEELSWLPLIESGFKVKALSRARALGMWQFIASTGYKYGLKRDRWVDERMDPAKSTAAAIAYLKDLHQIFGDWDTVLAAYNCGEGRVLRVIKTQRVNYLDHFWDLYGKLPAETAFYVPKFLAVLHIINDPKAYGFTLPPVDKEIGTETVTMHKQVSLKTMAKHIGVSYEVLRELNPALRRNSTPPRPYAFRVPMGKGPTLLAELDKIPQWRPPIPTYVTHRVRRGETLSTIARKYRTSVKAIMARNHLRSRSYIKTGWKLKIPTRVRYASAGQSAASHPSSKRVNKPPKKPALSKYRVRKGDSLWKIANRFNTTTKAIQSLNGLHNSRLSIGQVLVISKPSAAYSVTGTEMYRVRKGDSPYIIAQKHQMDLAEFLRMNRLTPRSTIFPGQTLSVKPR
ncbi:MAG: LysM peptidoglycan-binding domain-containing protein [Desulfobacteraceae bacterium]|uniref:LysM peptidoglycan-binding domain-containing protein n=1 Tax=Candidatus Desulfacyla euxinica TaxID=2841693 RepID=A0A8J6MZ01_9DELT|nr:LysM peptidoglycan-binding domain-containing protein [Candidatus Desulfacyla euxinica]MBL6977489.1 LysM peptidoglycan-binding domain-containing protein [Desulfobacteraceae bacterium]MBL7216235.1 LysM peptidoglycan-binding domain-containing protein [Desulfobacteraceae bacterium]